MCLGLLLTASRSQAADYFVAPTGSDTNPGTMAAPFATVQKAVNAPSPGDTVWLRAGPTSTRTDQLSRRAERRTPTASTSGPIRARCRSSTARATCRPTRRPTCRRILVTGSWLHLQGLEIANGPVGASGDHSISRCARNGASNNIFELLNIHHNFGPGLFIDSGTGGNLILNCDSHDNYDKNGSQGDGQNGDGFGVHYQTTRSQHDHPRLSRLDQLRRRLRSDLARGPGHRREQLGHPERLRQRRLGQPGRGNGNGFKVGSSKTGIRHIVQNNVAWKNKAAGFYANHSSGGNTWLNNTSYMNGTQYNMLASPAGDSDTTIIADRRAGAQDAKQHRVPQPEQQHGRRRHHVQHLGPEHHARRAAISPARRTPAPPGRAKPTAACRTSTS